MKVYSNLAIGFLASSICCGEKMNIAMEEGEIAPSAEMADRMDKFQDKLERCLGKVSGSGKLREEAPKDFHVTVSYWGVRGIKITFFGLLKKEEMIDAALVALSSIKDTNIESICIEFYERRETRKIRDASDKYTNVEVVSINKVSGFEWRVQDNGVGLK